MKIDVCRSRKGNAVLLSVLLLSQLATTNAQAQFTSGSNGSDGALNISAPGVTVFDPAALSIDPDGDNVFHFTTVNVAAGATLKLRGNKLRNRAVIFLASGDVTIAGALDLSGEDGYSGAGDMSLRGASQPGPGGYPGGVGSTATSPRRNGAGPGGAAFATANSAAEQYGCGASHATQTQCGGVTPPIYGNALLLPLLGGSGGGGGGGNFGGGGGAGGGALRISSSTKVTVNGVIRADGGSYGAAGAQSFPGGPGSGGAIHLQAPLVEGSGGLSAAGGTKVPSSPCCFGDPLKLYATTTLQASVGRIRIDTDPDGLSGAIGLSSPAPRIGPLFAIQLPTNEPTVRISTVAGQAVPLVTGGTVGSVDVNMNDAGPVAIQVAATYVPLGTVVKVYITSEVGTDQVVDTSALAGALSSSTASVTVTLPAGVSKLFAQAKW